jgi:hypothetical protein
MTALELTQWQLEHTGRQLEKALEGLNDEGFSHRSSKSAMSPAEVVEHLCECYSAMSKSCDGEEHEWGTFSIEDKSPANLLAQLRLIRSEALAKLANANDDQLKSAFLYGTEHDAYHIGQLCTVRIELDPSWNPYSIYEEA